MSEVTDMSDSSAVFDAKPIAGAAFGIEVATDLSGTFSEPEKEALRALYRRDGLLLFRGQKLSKSQQIAACDIFAPALPEDAIENFIVSNVEEDGVLGDRELLFHNDVPFVPAPFLGGALYALEVDAGVSTTRFANAMSGFEALPDDMQRRIEPMNAIHVRARAFTRRSKLSDCEPQDNCAVHALVGMQEDTGRPYMFACMDMTAQVIGLSEPDSDALLEQLFATLYAPENIYEHSWQAGDLVIWDNLAIQHARSEIVSGRRTLQRVTMGKWGYWEQCPVDLPTFDELHEQATE